MRQLFVKVPEGQGEKVIDLARQQAGVNQAVLPGHEEQDDWDIVMVHMPNRQVAYFLEELDALLIRRGSLTDAERIEIQHHVTHTFDFLVRIPWGRSLAKVPEIAAKHHEYLDGSGYPSRIAAPEIPLQARMMTVADIFDALTASDRPYKKAVPVPLALDILRAEQREGKLDEDVLQLFLDAKVYEGTRS